MRSAKSSAERVRKFREKRAQEDPSFLKEESKRVEKCRKRRVNQMTEREKRKYRECTRERVHSCRARKKQAGSVKEKASAGHKGPGFKSPQSLGKAVHKLTSNLPKSPSKQKAAVCGLACRVGLSLQNDMDRNLNQITKQGLTQEVQTLVTDLYMNDTMVSWKDGKKMKLRKYYLVMFLKEAFTLFKGCYPGIEIGFSKFAALRPANVLLLKDQPADQCKCRTHEDFTLKLKPLGISYGSDFWDKILCYSEDLGHECWIGTCTNCQNGAKLITDHDMAEEVFWKQWEKADSGRLKLITKQGCVGELMDEILDSISSFQEHVRIKRIQSDAFEQDKKDPDVTVLQCDFAMAYSCEYQSEVQSALWSRQSVNLFTAALYHKNEKCRSYLL